MPAFVPAVVAASVPAVVPAVTSDARPTARPAARPTAMPATRPAAVPDAVTAATVPATVPVAASAVFVGSEMSFTESLTSYTPANNTSPYTTTTMSRNLLPPEGVTWRGGGSLLPSDGVSPRGNIPPSGGVRRLLSMGNAPLERALSVPEHCDRDSSSAYGVLLPTATSGSGSGNGDSGRGPAAAGDTVRRLRCEDRWQSTNSHESVKRIGRHASDITCRHGGSSDVTCLHGSSDVACRHGSGTSLNLGAIRHSYERLVGRTRFLSGGGGGDSSSSAAAGMDQCGAKVPYRAMEATYDGGRPPPLPPRQQPSGHQQQQQQLLTIVDYRSSSLRRSPFEIPVDENNVPQIDRAITPPAGPPSSSGVGTGSTAATAAAARPYNRRFASWKLKRVQCSSAVGTPKSESFRSSVRPTGANGSRFDHCAFADSTTFGGGGRPGGLRSSSAKDVFFSSVQFQNIGDEASLYGTPKEELTPMRDTTPGGGKAPSNTVYLREQIIAMFQPSDNKLAMKLFGNKNALMKEKMRQKAAGNWVIHPCSNFR